MKLAIDFDALEDITFGADPNNFSGGNIGDIVTAIIPYFFTFAGILLLIYLIMGGFELMTSQGNPKAVESGRGKITFALYGFLIVFIAFWIVQIVGLLFGIDAIGSIFG